MPQQTQCGKGKGRCPGDIQSRLRELTEASDKLNGSLATLGWVLQKMRLEIEKRNEENQHVQFHKKCTPLNCTLKQCPDPCGPPPCSVENTCPMYINEVCRKYALLWCHLAQVMTERSHLKCENYELQKQIDIMIDKYETKHDEKDICICCENLKKGYTKCPCCDCLDGTCIC